MTSLRDPEMPTPTRFQLKLLAAMMVVVCGITVVGLYVQERHLASEVERELQNQFQTELASLHNVQEIRRAALSERSRALVRKPRIHAALEDNALDLLYPTALDELHDVMGESEFTPDPASHPLRAEFYRFLDVRGAVLSSTNIVDVGVLRPTEEAQLALPSVPLEQQLGYVVRTDDTVAEILAVPIISTETREVIAALVLGFKPVVLGARAGQEMKSGIWVDGRLRIPLLDNSTQKLLENKVSQAIARPSQSQNSFPIDLAGTPHLLFYKRLNPNSLYSPAYEVCLFALTDLASRQRHLRWQILAAGGLMLLIGLGASHFFSARLSVPVEKLAVDSELNRAQRERAETALEKTNIELQRSARFSADASHQLKTPVTVLRAGLEELMAQENLSGEVREEISQLVHQTFRLTGVIEDLLLLSRMDAGRLQLTITPVDISRLIEAELDDLSAQPGAMDLTVDADLPPTVYVAGEKRFTTLIIRNLLENAQKYNRVGGSIGVAVRETGGDVFLSVRNTGIPIPNGAKEHIFERFHRGAVGENVPGHGLGLNLARELACLHGGDIRLVRSDESGTEFEVRFCAAKKTDASTIV